MLLKKINCRVSERDVSAFTKGQLAWRRLSVVPGFHLQLGGWEINCPTEASIFALWKDEAAVDNFTRQYHDKIYHESGQKKWIKASSIDFFKLIYPQKPDLNTLPGILSNTSELISLSWGGNNSESKFLDDANVLNFISNAFKNTNDYLLFRQLLETDAWCLICFEVQSAMLALNKIKKSLGSFIQSEIRLDKAWVVLSAE